MWLRILASWLTVLSAPEPSVSRHVIEGDGGRNVELVVYLPPSYASSDERYPVIYHLHGLSTRGRSAALDAVEASTRLLARTQEAAVQRGVVPEAILVAPYDGVGYSMWSDSSDGTIHAESDLIETILPHMDANYRTLARRSGRVIQGFSMGGYGAIKNAVKFPEHFAVAVNYDGALHDWSTLTGNRLQIAERVFGGDARYYDEQSPWTHYEELGPWRLRIRTNVGLLEAYNETLKAHLDTLDVVHDYVQTTCGHDLACLLDETGIDTFRFIGDALAASHDP